MSDKTIYLDYQATTPLDKEVFEAMLPYFTEKFANPSSASLLGADVNAVIDEARTIIASAINSFSSEILFTGSATESINMALKGLFDFDTKGHIITVKSEHSAVLNTCRFLEKKGVSITYLDVQEDGLVNLEDLVNAIQDDTKLIAIMHVNNEIGVIQPIEAIGKICKKKNIIFFVDAAQSFSKIPIDVKRFSIDLLAISGHKIYGPKGIGALYVNKKIKNKIAPLLHGGGQEDGLRSGTLNVTGIIGLAKATQIAVAQMQIEQQQILNLRNKLLHLIQTNVSDTVVNGNIDNRIAGNLNICFKNVSGDVLLNKLEQVIVSRGSACNASHHQGSHVLKAIGLSDNLADSAIRISIGRFTTDAEIEYAAEKITAIVTNIREISTIF
jgi:cysteine desulfurase